METFRSVHDATGLDLPELDITQLEHCHAKLKEFRPDIVINAAAFTQVDACESREKEAFLVNGHGAGNLAAAAAAARGSARPLQHRLCFRRPERRRIRRRRHCQIRKASTENPSSWARRSFAGDCPNHLILRTSWLFGRNGNNFIRTIVGAAQKRKSAARRQRPERQPHVFRRILPHTRGR